MTPGPPLQTLMRRLSECPPEFLAAPRIVGRGEVHVDAVVADLMIDLGAPLREAQLFEAFKPDSTVYRNWLRIVLIAAWLLHDPWFREQATRGDADFAAPALRWLLSGLADFSDLIAADACVEDVERREELARRCLSALSLTPEGETETQAHDRLATLDSIEQRRVLRETRNRQSRADNLRREMAEKRAREAAGRWTRE